MMRISPFASPFSLLAVQLAVRNVWAGAPYCLSGDDCFPSGPALAKFNNTVNGHLIKIEPYGSPCYAATYDAEKCRFLAKNKGNHAWRAQVPGAVMFSNWEQTEDLEGCVVPNPNEDGTPPTPVESECTLGGMSHYAVEVESADEIAKAVRFASKYNLRLRIKNTGHCYTGRSSGEGSFSIWTHKMNDLKLIKDFVPTGSCLPRHHVISAGPGLTMESLVKAGGDNGIVTMGGYAATVGATGGYIIGGGVGPLGHIYGLGVDNVVQFDVVTADGKQISANERVNSDLFWALRGGGGTFAVVTRVYLKAYPPFKAVNMVYGLLRCEDDASFKNLINVLVDLQMPLRENGHVGIWQSLPTSHSVAYLSIRPFIKGKIATQNETIAHFTPAMKVKGCKADLNTAQFTGSASWSEAYHNVLLPMVESGGSVGVNLIDVSRMITYETMSDRESLQKLKNHIGNSNAPVIWQNSVGKAVNKVAPDATAVHPKWREAFAFINEPIFGPWQGLNDNMLKRAKDTIEKLNELLGNAAYYNEQFPLGEDWQDQLFGSNYNRLLLIKNKVDPDGVFSCRRCVGSERGY